MAVNCCATWFGIDGLAGVTVIVSIVAVVTVSIAEPVRPAYDAEMVVEPAVACATARPRRSTVAMFVSDDLQVTKFVMSSVSLSVKVPIAVNCRMVFAATEGFAGVTNIERSVLLVAAAEDCCVGGPSTAQPANSNMNNIAKREEENLLPSIR